jgi:methionyl-tRNA formyltransferase
MKISILCSDPDHPVVVPLRLWQDQMNMLGHTAELLFNKREIVSGDILFLVSCGQLIGEEVRQKFRATFVLHASNLPQGRGWSPHIWAILNDTREITVCLLEARDPVDTGPVWLKSTFSLEGHELLPEINKKLFATELFLMTQAVEKFETIKPVSQSGDAGQYMPKRSPEDSRLDPDKSIASQFDLLRVVDSKRYPAFMDYRGHRYLIRIEKQ